MNRTRAHPTSWAWSLIIIVNRPIDSLQLKWTFNDKSFSKSSKILQSLRRQHFDVVLVAEFVLSVPSVENSFYDCGDIILRFADRIITDVLANVPKDSRVSATVVLRCAGSRMKTSNVSQIFIPPKGWHSRRWCVTRYFAHRYFVSKLIVKIENQLFMDGWHQNKFGIFTTVLSKLLLTLQIIPKTSIFF